MEVLYKKKLLTIFENERGFNNENVAKIPFIYFDNLYGVL